MLLEIDVTAARAAIHDRKAKTGERISFTGWIVKCIAQAVSEHKHVHALRNGKKEIGIAKRSGIIHDEIAIREYVGLTVLFDHDVTDGAPVGRFIRRLQKLMADRYGLED
jgi:pyruvate/2-oxoglutarate dehydrogenase complex dihydrolipoamide acyltransferase (E2) component